MPPAPPQTDPVLMILLLIGLAAAPFAAMMATSYTKIVVVLSLLRNALGVQQVPPAIVLNGLAIVLSVYVMYPVGSAAWQAGQTRLADTKKAVLLSDLLGVADAAKVPLKGFLHKHSTPRERQFFLRSAGVVMGEEIAATLQPDDLVVLVPAFVSSELTEAFEIGFLLFLPFLVIDLIVAALLTALGMQMVSPNTIALPFKLLLLVTLDGWTRLLHALVLTYR